MFTRDIAFRDLATDKASEPGQEIPCRLCASPFVRGDWCFYDLCGECFQKFDAQKMDARCGVSPGTEDVARWISEQRQ